MHRLATVHARDNQRPTTNQPMTNQPTTNDVTTQRISISASFATEIKNRYLPKQYGGRMLLSEFPD